MEDTNTIPRYGKNSYFYSSCISLHHCEITSISHEDKGIVQSSNVDLVVKDESCVVDSCHKHSGFLY